MTKETPTLVQIDSTNGENQTMANGCTDFICKFDLRSTALILLMSLLYFVIEILPSVKYPFEFVSTIITCYELAFWYQNNWWY
jgi:hypothetical protein